MKTRKQYFRVNKDLDVCCTWINTRYGFKHEAEFVKNGFRHFDFAKVCYYNRTWESFEFETVIEKLLENSDLLTKRQKTIFLKKLREEDKKRVNQYFGMVAGIAKIGEILCNDQKEKNDWKTRMLKAGLPGISIPEDWDTLSEDEKEKRLNNVINELSK